MPGESNIKFTQAKRDKFIELVRQGCTVAGASAGVGVHPRTAYLWRNKDEEFEAAWDMAEANLYQRLEQAALAAISDDATTRIFLMKGAWPERHVETRRNEHSGPNGQPIEVQHRKPMPSELQNEIEAHTQEIEGE